MSEITRKEWVDIFKTTAENIWMGRDRNDKLTYKEFMTWFEVELNKKVTAVLGDMKCYLGVRKTLANEGTHCSDDECAFYHGRKAGCYFWYLWEQPSYGQGTNSQSGLKDYGDSVVNYDNGAYVKDFWKWVEEHGYKQPLATSHSTCPDCKGIGESQVDIPCSKCKGTGEVEK